MERDTGHTIDRIGRGTIHVEACCMSMLGGIQPGRLRSYLVDALEDGPSNDGLIQRFQLLVWPDTAPDWNYVDRAPDAASEQHAARVFQNWWSWTRKTRRGFASLAIHRNSSLSGWRNSKRRFAGKNSTRR